MRILELFSILVFSQALIGAQQGSISGSLAMSDGQFAILRCEGINGSTVGLRIITTKTAPEAERIRSLLKAGESFESLATQHSTHPSKTTGGALGEVQLDDLAEPFQAAVRQLECPKTAVAAPARPNGAQPPAEATAAPKSQTPRPQTLPVQAPKIVAAAKSGSLATVKLELSRKADPNVRDGNGMTPLMWAALFGHRPVVAALLAAGAGINEVDSKGGSAFDYATLAHQDAVTSLLTSSGGRTGLPKANDLDGALTVYLWTGTLADEAFKYVESRKKAK